MREYVLCHRERASSFSRPQSGLSGCKQTPRLLQQTWGLKLYLAPTNLAYCESGIVESIPCAFASTLPVQCLRLLGSYGLSVQGLSTVCSLGCWKSGQQDYSRPDIICRSWEIPKSQVTLGNSKNLKRRNSNRIQFNCLL